MFKRIVGVAGVVGMAFGCSGGDGSGLATGTLEQAALGDPGYCTVSSPCSAGEGDCNKDTQCVTGLICGFNNGENFGFGRNVDCCVEEHCENGIQDADETGVDCGGADCGTCPNVDCSSQPENGEPRHCTEDCPCPAQEGHCYTVAECQTDLVCATNKGPQFGFGDNINMCLVPHCDNGIQDADETHVDCGGADCGSDCTGVLSCDDLPPNGDPDHCAIECPCPAKEGDCDSDAECTTGNVCVANTGGSFGFGDNIDMCLGDHCDDGVLNGDESDVDCGGSCVPCSGDSFWIDAYGGTDVDLVEAAAVDSSGNVIIAGRFKGTTNLGGSDLTSNGSQDVFLAKYDSQGNHVFSKNFGGPNADGDFGVDVAVDKQGNIILGGNFYTTANFGGGSVTSNGAADMFVAKYDPNGNHLWSNYWGGAGQDRVGGVAVTGNNDVAVSGTFEGTVTFGGGSETSAGSLDAIVMKLAADTGATRWQRRFGGVGGDQATGVGTTHGGHAVFFTGSFGDSVTFGATTHVSNGAGDAFLAQVYSNGSIGYFRAFGGGGADRGLSVAVDANGNATVGGFFSGSVDFGAGAVTSNGGADVFVRSYDFYGTPRWVSTFGSSSGESAQAVAFAPGSTDIVVAGRLADSSADFPTGATTSLGGADAFFLRYTSAGTAVSGGTHGGSTGDSGQGVGASTAGIAWTGYFTGSATISGSSFTSAGERDTFVELMAD